MTMDVACLAWNIERHFAFSKDEAWRGSGRESFVLWNVNSMCRFDLNCRMYQLSRNCWIINKVLTQNKYSQRVAGGWWEHGSAWRQYDIVLEIVDVICDGAAARPGPPHPGRDTAATILCFVSLITQEWLHVRHPSLTNKMRKFYL